MRKIEHQLKQSENYIPNWPIKHLFIGTFNPSGGARVNYYYGREKNQFWNLISKVFKEEIHPDNSNFLTLLKKHKIACMDLIDSVTINEEKSIEDILGRGYSDSAIINNSVVRDYNTDKIVSLLNKNPGVKIYSTWGTGANLKEWKKEVAKIDFLKLVSPSMAARVPKGTKKFVFMLSDWTEKITLV